MVRKGVHYWFFFVCMGQLFWSLSFGLNQIEMSTLFMAFILFCLVALEYCQYKTRSDGTKPEYWLLRFPFEVHTGWIVAAFAVNSNVAAVKWEASSSALFGLAIASIVYIIICAAISLFVLQKPNYAVPLTLSWATFGIAEGFHLAELFGKSDRYHSEYIGCRLCSTYNVLSYSRILEDPP